MFLYCAILPALAQVVVGEGEREHGFDDGAGAQGDAGVMPPFGDDGAVIPEYVGAAAGDTQ